MAIRRCHSHEDRCTRHHRWIARTREYDLQLLTWTHLAHRHHRQMAQRFGPSAVDRAYLNALREKVEQFGFGRARVEPALGSRLDALGEDPYGDPLNPSSERLELVTYPDVINQIARTLRQWQPKPTAQENAINTEKHRPEFSSNLSRRSSHTSPDDMINEKSSIDAST